jgi:hypothetical protein
VASPHLRPWPSRVFTLFATLAGLALVLVACQSPSVPKRPPEEQAVPEPPIVDVDEFAGIDFDRPANALVGPVRAGLLLPLSGQHAPLGQILLNAAQMALYDVGEERFALSVHDTGGTPSGALAAAEAALAGGARILIGPLFAASVNAIAPLARQASVRVIAFSNDLTVAGDGVIVMGLPPRPQILRIVDYASRQGITRFAVLTPRSPYGEAVLAAAREAVFLSGSEIVRNAVYPRDALDISAEVRALADYDKRHEELLEEKEKLEGREDEESKQRLAELETLDTLEPPDFEAVVVAEAGERLRAIAPLFPYYDVDPQAIRLLGTALWDDPAMLSEPTLQGGWFAALSPDEWSVFRQRYESYHGTPPPRLAPLAYDATALAAILSLPAIRENRQPDYPLETLYQTGGFIGIDGVFRFLPTGETERTLSVLEIGEQGFNVLEPAPSSFLPAVF